MALLEPSPFTRSWSLEFIPPNMCELRVALLGNSWRQRCFVESFLIGKDKFRTDLQCSTRVSAPLRDKEITVVNTPDLLHPDLTEEELTEKIEEFAAASEPGPHVLLLVLQPEDFSSQQQERLQKVLEKFNENSFDHSMVLILSDREESVTKNTPLGKIIRKCRYRHMWMKNTTEEETEVKNFKLAELFSRMGQIVKDNQGDILTYEVSEAPPSNTMEQETKEKTKVSEASQAPTNFRILLFGKCDDEKQYLSQFITEVKSSRTNRPKVEHGEWRGKHLTVVKTADLFSMSVEKQKDELKKCVSACYPGPNVLLLLVKPSDFTEDNRETLKFILTMLGPNAFKHSILIFTHPETTLTTASTLLQDCELRVYNMPDKNLSGLMEVIESMVQTNKGSFVTVAENFSKEIKMSLNLVVCGRRGAGKTSAADTILGQRSSSENSSSECIKRQRELHGRWLSIVEMPSLCGSSAQTAMEQCFNSISLCDPDGVHALSWFYLWVHSLMKIRNGQPAESLRIVLIGKTGSGKSSSGNTILDENSSNLASKAVCKVDGRRVEVVDTPGLFDSTMSNYEVNEEMLKCISLLAPGPHVFLLVLQIGRFTPEEKETLKLIKTGFGKDAEKFTLVLFTHGDDVEEVGLSLEEYVNTKIDDSCKKLISDCGNRCHLFNNKEKDTEKKSIQVKELIKKIDDVVKANGGGCYTSEMFLEAEAAIQKETQRLLKEQEQKLRREMEQMEEKYKMEMQEIQQIMEKQSKEIERECQEREEELKELEEIKRERSLRGEEQKKREEEAQHRKEQDKARRQEYERKLQELEIELTKRFDRKLQETKDKMEKDREAWEEERRQWWETRHKQDEIGRQEEHSRLEKLEQEYKNKLEMYRNKKEEEDQNRCEQEEKQRKELQERYDKEKEELRRTYEEACKKTEEFYDSKLKREIELATMMDKHLREKLQESRDKMQKDREAWEEERKQEQHSRLEKLEQEYQVKMYKIKKEETQSRCEQEENQKKELERHDKQVEELRRVYEEEARKKAEEFNDFKIQKEIDFATLTDKHLEEVTGLKEEIQQGQEDYKSLQKLTSHKETTLKSEIEGHHKKHKTQMIDLAILVLKKENSNKIREHVQEMNLFTETRIRKHEEEQNKLIQELEQRQKQEMEELLKKAGESEVQVEQLRMRHQQEMNDIKRKMLPEEGLCSIL
ncbi:hypothetical protein WMY93_022166 [Mugilogobius chulae]|uniref:AIG1-type G domain-containing protein n=1 Tax=Mugilogobius chulae TaxID=88201 RepID=A0AAW0NH36_9GOBI